MSHTKQSFFQKLSNSVILNLYPRACISIIQNQSKHKNYSAFTLVELIVVIVILAILATIAFLSFNSYSSSSRDSVRLSDVTNISKGLLIQYTNGGKYILPDNYITLYSSGMNIGYQGYIGNNIMRTINMSNSKDPLDSTYYTYNVNSDQTKFQLLGFLEDGTNINLSLNNNLINADSSDFSKRFLFTKGNQIGILINSGTNTPVQLNSSLTGINLTSTGFLYRAVFSNNDIINQSNNNPLISNFLIYNNVVGKDNIDSSLVGYYDMETLTGSAAKDLGPYGNDTTCITASLGWATVNGDKSCPSYVSGGIKGKAAKFQAPPSTTNSDYNYLEIINNLPQLGGTSAGDHTISTWIKTDGVMQDINDTYALINLKSSGNLCGVGAGSQVLYSPTLGRLYFSSSTAPGGGAGFSVIGNASLNSDWNNVVETYNSATNEGKIYLNGNLVNKRIFSGGVNYYNGTQVTLFGAQPLYGCYRSPGTLGATYGYNGLMDEVRIYSRELSEGEINQIYINKK